MLNTNDKTILFFDGVCNLCNGFIDFLIQRDSKGLFYYAPLQGETAEAMVPEHAQELKSVVLLLDKEVFTESEAALRALAQLGGLWKMCLMFLIFPKFLRDSVYRVIAGNRYRLFGKRESCRLPTAEEKSRFLD